MKIKLSKTEIERAMNHSIKEGIIYEDVITGIKITRFLNKRLKSLYDEIMHDEELMPHDKMAMLSFICIKMIMQIKREKREEFMRGIIDIVGYETGMEQD